MKQGNNIAITKISLTEFTQLGKKDALKDHKPNFESNNNTRTINPAKNEIGRLSKAIIENINKQLRNNLHLQQWSNTRKVNDLFKNVQNKSQYKIMIFDIKEFYPSISKESLADSINFAKLHAV